MKQTKQETDVLDNAPVQKTEAQIRAEILEQLKSEGKLAEEKKVEIQPSYVQHEYKSKLVTPRRIIFEIKGVEYPDSMFDGSYIAGKSVGVSGYKLISDLVNRNATFSREEDNFVTGFEVEEIYQSPLPEEVKQQRIQDVQIARAWLENKYSTSLDKKNYKFWGDYSIKIVDLGEVYDTHRKGTTKNNDPLLMYYTILGGGHPDIALSNDDAKRDNKFYYITEREAEAVRKFSGNRQAITAISYLKEIMDNWSTEDVLSLTYYLITTPHGYTLSTPRDILVQELKDFIDAINFRIEKKEKPGLFIDAVESMQADKNKINITARFNAALYYGFIVETPQHEFVNRQTGFNYGGNKSQAIGKLLSPKYVDELSDVIKRVGDKWKL